jgi:hypothetical protein
LSLFGIGIRIGIGIGMNITLELGLSLLSSFFELNLQTKWAWGIWCGYGASGADRRLDICSLLPFFGRRFNFSDPFFPFSYPFLSAGSNLSLSWDGTDFRVYDVLYGKARWMG